MWDDAEMRGAGFNDLATHREKAPEAARAPATEKDVRGEDARGVHVEQERPNPPPNQPAVAAPLGRSGGISWVMTFSLAIALGVAVYFLVRFLR